MTVRRAFQHHVSSRTITIIVTPFCYLTCCSSSASATSSTMAAPVHVQSSLPALPAHRRSRLHAMELGTGSGCAVQSRCGNCSSLQGHVGLARMTQGISVACIISVSTRLYLGPFRPMDHVVANGKREPRAMDRLRKEGKHVRIGQM